MQKKKNDQRKTRLRDRVLINKKKKEQVDFVVMTDRRVKLKESENVSKYLDIAREQKKTCGT